MARLIHLNGPPGIGKSTIANLYVEARPGTLNLDIDEVRRLIGGWRQDFIGAGNLVRPIALNMAETHLRQGLDVVMPQFLCSLSEIELFEAAATTSESQFLEIVLMDSKDRSVDRFTARGDDAEETWHREVQEIVRKNGGVTYLAEMYDQLVEVIRLRPSAVVVTSEAGAIDATFRQVSAVLNRVM
ncbi:MAG: AAA family ATPase [Candidatus Nanopelagicales bacterium]